MAAEDPLKQLQDALKLSPNNLPLRLHLAQSLLALGRFEDAALEYRQALTRAPGNPDVMLGLADCFFRQGKMSEALVIVEGVIRGPDTPPKAHLLHSRLLLKSGDLDQAARQYRRAVDADPSLADADLVAVFGLEPAAETSDGRVGRPDDEEDDRPLLDFEKPDVAFKDVGGMDGVKDEIRMKIIHPLTHPEMYKAYGKKTGGGILMYGPPGCGKTHLARATAGEIQARFMAVGIHEVLDMWIGRSERNLHEIFDQARANRPCVLFFDEVDALGASRTDMRQSAGRQLINQFLNELDGVKSDNDGVLVLAATNAPWHVDPAFRRPGRFDRILFVPPPDAPARGAILRILLTGKPQDNIDVDQLAKKTDAFSGADLKALVDVAVEGKLKEAMKSGMPKPLTTKDLATAAAALKPTTKEWFSSARNYALYSNQGGLYDDILKYLKLS